MNTVFIIWVTCSIIYCAKEWASPYARTFMLLDFICGPFLLFLDIMDEWREWAEIYKKNKTN